jgi:hypothetical protein
MTVHHASYRMKHGLAVGAAIMRARHRRFASGFAAFHFPIERITQ